MERYTEHTVTAKHTVLYRFVCEHCGKDSGWQPHMFIKSTNYRTGWQMPLPPEQEEKMRKHTGESLDIEISWAKTRAEKNKYSFKDHCPHCHKGQSWGTRKARNTIIFGIFMFACAVAIASFIEIEREIFWMVFGVGALIFIGTAAYAIPRFIKAAKTQNKQRPEIDWNGR